MLSILHWVEFVLIILIILLFSFLFYISSKFKDMVRQKEYAELIRLLKKAAYF